jgi:hypothetical protein
MTVLASSTATDSSYAAAVFGLVGVLIGAVVAGGVSLWTAKQTREAAERAWVRDNRREIYDRFLTCAQTLLVACENARKSGSEGAEDSVEPADVKLWEAYGVLLTVAGSTLADAARDYAYRLWELKESLGSRSVMGPGNFDRVTPLIRDGRHDTIDAMRAELGLEEITWPKKTYNPFDRTNLQEDYEQGLKNRLRPGAAL